MVGANSRDGFHTPPSSIGCEALTGSCIRHRRRSYAHSETFLDVCRDPGWSRVEKKGGVPI
jgi:hypothetical protein